MKRKLFSFIAIFVSYISFMTTANAAASDYTNITSKTWNPNMVLLTPSNTQIHPLSTNESTIKGSNVFVFFSSMQSLPSAFVASNERIMQITLFEDDADGNADETVKIYTYKFSGRLPDGVTYKTITSGNIDSSGDKKGEFYLQFFLYSVPEDDCYGVSTNNIIKYEIATK